MADQPPPNADVPPEAPQPPQAQPPANAPAPNPPVAHHRNNAPDNNPISRSEPLKLFKFRNLKQNFGRCDPLRDVETFEVSIDTQDTLSALTYNTLVDVCLDDIPITEEAFIRMWKTLLLKRCQDVFEKEYKQRPQNYVRLDRQVTIPAPLGDLLSSIGQFMSYSIGREFNIRPPARPVADIPRWWNLDQAIITNWQLTMETLHTEYQMKEYPSPSTYDSCPILLCTPNRANGYVDVKALTNEPKLTDGFITAVNDDLRVAAAPYDYDNSHLIMTSRLNEAQIRTQYVQGYIIDHD